MYCLLLHPKYYLMVDTVMQILSAHPVSIFRTQIFLRTFYACVGASVLTLFTPPPEN